ncbi:hypothetical protein BAE44_0006772 [Dichanthelium oligosanthes]|uniref:DUF1618 domain-containing protein n=1 Tax=Dichanthelium oligosanthes TaxID=888268 RepID=A0A1E5W464_9POAL|nr:hypothetical protein BAE44_0006772 [Dichanthelium oligosanthes]
MAPQWVVLSRSPCISRESPEGCGEPSEGCGISLELYAPPRTSQLVVFRSLVDRVVLAADPFGILLLSGSCNTDPPASPSYDLWDAVLPDSLSHIPAPERPANDTGVAGLVVVRGRSGHDHIMVAELSVCDTAATLRCFSTETAKWMHKNLRSSLIKCHWCSAYALSYKGRLWWVDLLQGLLACDPFADNPELHFVPLPGCYRLSLRDKEEGRRKGLSDDRCVSLSCGKLRLVVMNRRTRIKLWTLADYEAGKWSLDFDIPIDIIWAHQSYLDTRLPMERPKLAFVHPSNAHVVYFFLEHQLFAVDLQTKVTEAASNGRDDGGHVLAWELPPCLRIASSGPSPTEEWRSTFDFDSVADSFRGAYGHAFADMEFHCLSNMALAYLNRKKTEDNKFKLSDRLFLQIFLEDNIELKKYAHLNFYADTGSKKVLVFAEFYTDSVCDEERNEWALSSCKTLTRNYNGNALVQMFMHIIMHRNS